MKQSIEILRLYFETVDELSAAENRLFVEGVYDISRKRSQEVSLNTSPPIANQGHINN